MKKYLAILAFTLAGAFACYASAEDAVIVVRDLSPGQHVVILNVDADGNVEIARPKVLGIVTDGPTTPPRPPIDPPDTGLKETTKEALADVPDHPRKVIAAQALAAIFQEIGTQIEEGRLAVKDAASTLDKAMDAVLEALEVAGHWVKFRQTIKTAVNDAELRPSQLPAAFDQISAGLSSDRAAIADILPHVISLITAIISGDQQAIITAVIKIVTALIAAQGR